MHGYSIQVLAGLIVHKRISEFLSKCSQNKGGINE